MSKNYYNVMSSFSQRKGIKLKSIIQLDSIDEDLRNILWNVLSIYYWKQLENCTSISRSRYLEMKNLLNGLWINYFKKPTDSLNDSWGFTYKQIKNNFFGCEWYEVYDFIEYIANEYPDKSKNKAFIHSCNKMLEREVSAYRFVETKITQVTSEAEISEIEEALKPENCLKPVVNHLGQALNLLADRKSPDYRNSIKESILAVEATCQLITGNPKATLGQALGEIEKKVNIHPALKSSFTKLYGYTSDADGIRHALLEESNLNFEDAKFILVSCSAFINYLKSKALMVESNL
jgi:hypothetical protein